MSIGFILLLIVLASTLIEFLWSWPGLLGLRLMLVGAGLLFAAREITLRERLFLRNTAGPAFIGFGLIALWILLQLLPAGPFAHPFWESAANALHHSVANAISIDIGATALAFARFCLAIALVLLCATLSIDRTRAEWVLMSLTILTALLSVWILFGEVIPSWFGLVSIQPIGNDIFACEWLALILPMATANLAFERFETRRTRQPHAALRLRVLGGGCFLAFVAASIVLLQSPDPAVLFVAISAVSASLLLIFVRRFGLGPATGGTIILTLIAAGVLIAGTRHLRAADPALAYSSVSTHALDVTRRMIADAPWAGTGAGTFDSLLPLYQNFEDVTAPKPASAAAVLTVEFGRVVFWLVIAFVIFLIVRLLRGALTRGRDSSYPTAGCACLIALLLGGFVNAGVVAGPTGLLASAILGLALTQSESRTK